MRQTIRTALLRRVFNGHKKPRLFDAKLVRLCVLFEDLRVEIRGAAERSLPALDILDPEKENWLSPTGTGQYRKFYFIRRSLATLRDFAEALRLIIRDMNSGPGLRLTFAGLPDEAPALWDAAIRFFHANEALLQAIRNDIGGHFGVEAARNALSTLQPGTCGSITLVLDVVERRERRTVHADQQLRLHFAAEIAATALLKHLPNGDIAQYGAFLRDILAPGYQHAINCVDILVREYLWERFGS
jgi:hypothetical protein